MVIAAALVLLGATGHQSSGQPASTPGNTLQVALVRQHLDMLEVSARQVKAKSGGDPQALAALEKQYADTSTAVDTWRTAALSTASKDWSGARKRIEDLSRITSRAVVDFGRSARTYISGREASVDPRAVSQIMSRFVDAARAVVGIDEQGRQKLAAALSCGPWGDIR